MQVELTDIRCGCADNDRGPSSVISYRPSAGVTTDKAVSVTPF